MASMDCCGKQGTSEGWSGDNIAVTLVLTFMCIFSPCQVCPCSNKRGSSRPEAAANPEAACTAQSSTPPPQRAAKDIPLFYAGELHLESIVTPVINLLAVWEHSCTCLCAGHARACFVSYHKGNDAPLRWLPLKAAVDVGAIADQDHDASLHTVKILLKQL